MEKSIVVYFSKTGSNKYLAEKIARNLNCPIEAIRPRVSVFPFMLLSSFTKISTGIHPLEHNLNNFEKVILVGPIWMGRFISPLRNFVKKYRNQIRHLYFATCCGSTDAMKDDKFGYGHVFSQLKEIIGDKTIHCEAFPVALVMPEDKVEDGQAIMDTRLSDQNFTGKIRNRFEHFMEEVAV